MTLFRNQQNSLHRRFHRPLLRRGACSCRGSPPDEPAHGKRTKRREKEREKRRGEEREWIGEKIDRASCFPRPFSLNLSTSLSRKNSQQWVIHDALNPALDAKLYSETFYAGGHPWNVLCYPRGNKQDNLALYVNAADAGSVAAVAGSQADGGDDAAALAADDWAPRRAWFKLSLLHPSGDEARASSRDATHTFVPAAVDWGFTNFLPLPDVKAEFVHPDGSIVIRCELSMDPSVVPAEVLPGALYLGNQHYDCRRETGHGKRREKFFLLF